MQIEELPPDKNGVRSWRVSYPVELTPLQARLVELNGWPEDDWPEEKREDFAYYFQLYGQIRDTRHRVFIAG